MCDLPAFVPDKAVLHFGCIQLLAFFNFFILHLLVHKSDFLRIFDRFQLQKCCTVEMRSCKDVEILTFCSLGFLDLSLSHIRQ